LPPFDALHDGVAYHNVIHYTWLECLILPIPNKSLIYCPNHYLT
jgi:hypothetical protein